MIIKTWKEQGRMSGWPSVLDFACKYTRKNCFSNTMALPTTKVKSWKGHGKWLHGPMDKALVYGTRDSGFVPQSIYFLGRGIQYNLKVNLSIHLWALTFDRSCIMCSIVYFTFKLTWCPYPYIHSSLISHSFWVVTIKQEQTVESTFSPSTSVKFSFHITFLECNSSFFSSSSYVIHN